MCKLFPGAGVGVVGFSEFRGGEDFTRGKGNSGGV